MCRSAARRIRRWAAPVLLALLLACGRGAAAAETYTIDQRFGDITFTVHHLGLFDSSGTFRRFTGQLTVDEAHPGNTQIAVVIDTDSVAMTWAEATSMLRSAAYFDVSEFKVARFTSSRVLALSPGHYEIDGALELRGVTQPVVLQAALLGRHAGDKAGEEIADFVVTGALSRLRYGMTADQSFVSDRVDLRINARVRLTAASHGG